MHRSHPAEAAIEPAVLDAGALRRWPMPDVRDADKYERGTVLVVGGSPSTPGAVLLAGIAALRMGAGRLKLATHEAVSRELAVAVPEAMVVGLPSTRSGLAISPELASQMSDVDALVIGPGMVADVPPTELLRQLCDLLGAEALLVIDALALGAFAELDRRRREELAPRLVMTPNRQELARLADRPEAADLSDTLRVAARDTASVLSCFGTVQSPDGRSWQTDAGAPALGTSGSGDVLAGLVGGGAARCREPLQAACWATFAHMEAGRRLSDAVGWAGYLARELLDEVPRCLPRPGDSECDTLSGTAR